MRPLWEIKHLLEIQPKGTFLVGPSLELLRKEDDDLWCCVEKGWVHGSGVIASALYSNQDEKEFADWNLS